MKVLVTGGAGFIGSHVVDALDSQGDEVLVIDDLSAGSRTYMGNVNLVEADIRSPRALQAVLRFRPDVMLLLAAQSSVISSMRDPIHDAEVNIIGLLRLLRAGEEAGCARFVFATSGGTIYGNAREGDSPTTETHRREPLSYYGISKSAGVSYAEAFAARSGTQVVSLALGNVYGPRQDPSGEAGVVSIFAQNALNGIASTIYGDGLSSRDFVHVRDAANAFVLACRVGRGLINIGTGVGVSVLEVLEEVSLAVGGRTPEALFVPGLPGEVRHVRLDGSRAISELGWFPTIDFRTGVRETVAWLADRISAGKSDSATLGTQ